jgi:hypothetical protein
MDTLYRAEPFELDTPEEFHLRLSGLNRRCFTPALPSDGWECETLDTLPLLREESASLEGLRRRAH